MLATTNGLKFFENAELFIFVFGALYATHFKNNICCILEFKKSKTKFVLRHLAFVLGVSGLRFTPKCR